MNHLTVILDVVYHRNMKIKKTIIKKEVDLNFRQRINDIAKFVGVSRQTVWNWKTKKSFPNDEHLAKLQELNKIRKNK